jgi:ribokinase
MNHVSILGIFVADLAFRASRAPAMGETIIGSGFKMGPGGKGSNQAVAAARAGATVSFISRLGRDAFGEVALATWRAENIRTDKVSLADDLPTGAAYIFVHEVTGENCIIVVPGAGGAITKADVDHAAADIRSAKVFVTQLEQPIETAMHGLTIARNAGVTTIFNPAPARPLPNEIFALCDFITPNESEVSAITGIDVTGAESAKAAADLLLMRGVGTAVITLGAAGALYHTDNESILVPAFAAGKVVETTGAGDAFNGGFAAALAAGKSPLEAVRFACATAGIAVTRPGTAPAMPRLSEIEALLAR